MYAYIAVSILGLIFYRHHSEIGARFTPITNENLPIEYVQPMAFFGSAVCNSKSLVFDRLPNTIIWCVDSYVEVLTGLVGRLRTFPEVIRKYQPGDDEKCASKRGNWSCKFSKRRALRQNQNIYRPGKEQDTSHKQDADVVW